MHAHKYLHTLCPLRSWHLVITLCNHILWCLHKDEIACWLVPFMEQVPINKQHTVVWTEQLSNNNVNNPEKDRLRARRDGCSSRRLGSTPSTHIIIITIICVQFFFSLHVRLYNVHAWCLWRSEVGVRSLGTRVIDDFETQCGSWVSNPSRLEEQ